jgi:hypothetical protein
MLNCASDYRHFYHQADFTSKQEIIGSIFPETPLSNFFKLRVVYRLQSQQRVILHIYEIQ